MYVAKDAQQARETYFASAILDFATTLIIAFLGIVTYVGYSYMSGLGMICPTIIGNLSAIFQGFFVITLFVMTMSTADSWLNVASSMFLHDIVNLLCTSRLTDKQLYLAKIVCFIIGTLSIFLAVSASKYSDDLFRLPFLTMNIGNPTFVALFS